MAIQNLWDVAKAVLRGKFRAIQSYLGKQGKSRTKKPNLTLKATGERSRKKTGVSRRKKHKEQSKNKRNKKENNRKDC